eukprot:1992665-Amphidinium_carterae.1
MRLCCRFVLISSQAESTHVRLSCRMSFRASLVCCRMSTERVNDLSLEVASVCIVSGVRVNLLASCSNSSGKWLCSAEWILRSCVMWWSRCRVFACNQHVLGTTICLGAVTWKQWKAISSVWRQCSSVVDVCIVDESVVEWPPMVVAGRTGIDGECQLNRSVITLAQGAHGGPIE